MRKLLILLMTATALISSAHAGGVTVKEKSTKQQAIEVSGLTAFYALLPTYLKQLQGEYIDKAKNAVDKATKVDTVKKVRLIRNLARMVPYFAVSTSFLAGLKVGELIMESEYGDIIVEHTGDTLEFVFKPLYKAELAINDIGRKIGESKPVQLIKKSHGIVNINK